MGWEDLGCVEADAVPARGGRLRLGLIEEGDGAVAEPREVQGLPPSSSPLIEISLNQKLFLSPKRGGWTDVNISNHEQEQNSAP